MNIRDRVKADRLDRLCKRLAADVKPLFMKVSVIDMRTGMISEAVTLPHRVDYVHRAEMSGRFYGTAVVVEVGR